VEPVKRACGYATYGMPSYAMHDYLSAYTERQSTLTQQSAHQTPTARDSDKPLVAQLSSDATSAYQLYQYMFVGKPGLGAFLKYELLTGLLGGLPGAIGYFLRSRLYPRLCQKVGLRTVFGKHVMLRCPCRISLGSHVNLDDGVVLDAKGDKSTIQIGNRILIGRNTIFSCHDASIRLGDFLSIGPGCVIASRSRIEIGSYVQIGAGTQLMAGSHTYDDPEKPSILQTRVSKGIVVEDNVWLGNACMILDGVTIGRNSIVGAGSVVSKDVPPYSMVLGNPARVIGKRE